MKNIQRYLNPSVFILLLLLPLLHSQIGQAAEKNIPTLYLTSETQSGQLAKYIDRYVDKDGKLSYPEIVNAPFTPRDIHHGREHTKATHWFRIHIARESNAPKDWILTIGVPFLDHVDVWIQKPDGHVENYQLGDHNSYAERPLKSRLFGIPLSLTDQPLTLFIAAETIGVMSVNIDLLSPETFSQKETRDNFFLGLYFGILLIIILLYFSLGIWLKNSIMFAYAAHVTALFLMYLATNGYIPMLFPTGPHWLPNVITGIGTIGSMFTFTLFWVLLLDLIKTSPRIARLYLTIGTLAAFCFPFSTTPIYRDIVPVGLNLGLLLSLLNFILLLRLYWLYRRTEILLYIFAFIPNILGGVVTISTTLGYLPYTSIGADAYQVSSLIHILVMSLALTYRMRQIQQDKLHAQQEAFLSSRSAEEQRNFVAMLSHEFRTPLAAIDRAAEMLELKATNLAETDRQKLVRIRVKTNVLLSLVGNFMVSEALDRGSLTVSSQVCDVRQLLMEIIETLGEKAEARIKFSVIPPNASYSLDTKLIFMAISNLLANALRYSPPDSLVNIKMVNDNKGLQIEITNNGPSLSDEEISALGKPYYRGSTSFGTIGTGLGYFFSKRIIEAHGGQLIPDNKSENGMRFTLLLPPQED